MNSILLIFLILTSLTQSAFAEQFQRIVDFSAVDEDYVTFLVSSPVAEPGIQSEYHLAIVNRDGSKQILPVKREYFTHSSKAAVKPIAIAALPGATIVLAAVETSEPHKRILVLSMIKSDGSIVKTMWRPKGPSEPMLEFLEVPHDIPFNDVSASMLLDGEGSLWVLHDTGAAPEATGSHDVILAKIAKGKLDSKFAQKGIQRFVFGKDAVAKLYQPIGTSIATILLRETFSETPELLRHHVFVTGLFAGEHGGRSLGREEIIGKSAFQGEPMPFFIAGPKAGSLFVFKISSEGPTFKFTDMADTPLQNLNNKLPTKLENETYTFSYKSLVGGLGFLLVGSDNSIQYMFWSRDLKSLPSPIISSRIEALNDACESPFQG